MSLLPPIPAWDAVHPLVVHFPIALLLIAPVLVVAGLAWRAGARGLLVAALGLMLLGTTAAWVAVGSGRAAGELAESQDGSATERVLDRHEELAETTRNVFTALTLVFAAMLIAPLVTRRDLGRRTLLVAHFAFLAMYGGGLVYLVDTAHQGGRLVHEFGVHAALAPVADTVVPASVAGSPARPATEPLDEEVRERAAR